MTKYQESSIRNLAYNGCGCLLFFMGIVVVIGAIAMPSYLKKVWNIKQAEAKDYVRSINKGQQAYFAEKSVFSTSVKALGIGIKTETKNYRYSLMTTKKATFNYGVSKQKDLKSFVGGVFVIPATKVDSTTSKNKITTTSILCRADSPGTIKPPEPTNQNGKIACATGTIELKESYY